VSLSLYDTATGEVRPFVPRVPGRVGVYLCGATVQSPPHIGHIRSGVAFDVLRRWLGRDHEVTFVRNVTDIDDKVLARAAATGRPWWAIAYANERAFGAGYDALNVLPPTYEPRATGHVTEMITLITQLVDAGHAYPAADGSGDVYFDVLSWPTYGSLSHQRVQDMEPAADADPRGKRDPRDFALWKGRKDGDPVSAGWLTPWGPGRPGWHLECSAMARRYLGPAFDIHAGGLDLRFPHHENEQAQSRAAGDDFAAHWLHNGWVTQGGEKMSKSLGNGLAVAEVLRRVRPVELRYYLGAAHYRSAVEYSDRALADAAAAWRRIEGFLLRARAALATCGAPVAVELGTLPEGFATAMDDDLGVPAALAVLHETVRDGNRVLAASGDRGTPAVADLLASVNAMLDVLGLAPDRPGTDPAGESGQRTVAALDALVRAQLDQRAAARAARDYAAADAVRDRLTAAGVLVTDTPAGPTWSLTAHETHPTHEQPAQTHPTHEQPAQTHPTHEQTTETHPTENGQTVA